MSEKLCTTRSNVKCFWTSSNLRCHSAPAAGVSHCTTRKVRALRRLTTSWFCAHLPHLRLPCAAAAGHPSVDCVASVEVDAGASVEVDKGASVRVAWDASVKVDWGASAEVDWSASVEVASGASVKVA